MRPDEKITWIVCKDSKWKWFQLRVFSERDRLNQLTFELHWNYMQILKMPRQSIFALQNKLYSNFPLLVAYQTCLLREMSYTSRRTAKLSGFELYAVQTKFLINWRYYWPRKSTRVILRSRSNIGQRLNWSEWEIAESYLAKPCILNSSDTSLVKVMDVVVKIWIKLNLPY